MAEISKEIALKHKIVALLCYSSIFFAVYGLIIGSFHSWMQSLSSAIKLPSLYLITLSICLPTLYFFNILFGSRKSFTQHFAIVLAAVSSISVLLFSFAPITLFFLVTTPNYQFFKLLNVGILALTGLVGVKFLYQGMQLMSETEDNDEGKENREKLLKSWLFLYAFVGSQLGWTLRPFFGTPGAEFQLFREMGGNFYLDVVNSILSILGLK
ncbi:MAG: actin-binding WH2 domain-containing protein [Cyanobacteriota bacterium]|nr:actin-binding WH2 domain-containing protein [Cyanobacteriota bacterium]